MVKNENKVKHYVLGIPRQNTGTFEFAWGIAKNLERRGYDIDYIKHWWDSLPEKVNLSTENSRIIIPEKIRRKNGSAIYHLQSHTWEYEGLLDRIQIKDGDKVIYNLHAIIPYFYLNDKDAFLEGRISSEEMMKEVAPQMSVRECAQLSAIKKANYLFAISKSHKDVLEKMEVKAQVYVFENLSDFGSINDEYKEIARRDSSLLREKLNTENVILYCGNFYLGKGGDRLLDAFKDIRGEYKNSKLLLLGAGEIGEKAVKNSSLSSGDARNISIIPWIDKNTQAGKIEMLKYYMASDVLIQPMITENLFSKTVIDAMCIGLPTITCKSPYSIGQSRSKDDIVNAFSHMKNNPLDIESLVKSAKEKVKRENTWDSYISRMEEILSH